MTPKEFELALMEASEEFGTLRYDPNTCPTGNMMAKNIACKVGFRQGARWQRNHVWKDPRKDKIEDGDYLTVIYEGGSKVTAEIATWKNGEYQGAYCMLVFAGKANIGNVAKISDLLPTSFDDILEANKDVLQRLKKGETK